MSGSWRIVSDLPKSVEAGMPVIWEIDFEVGEELLEGTEFRLSPHGMRLGWGIGEFHFSGGGKCKCETSVVYQPVYRASTMMSKIVEGKISKGGTLKLILGNWSGVGQAFTAPTIAGAEGTMSLALKTPEMTDFKDVAQIPYTIIAAAPSNLMLNANDPCAPESKLDIVAVDHCYNPVTEFAFDIELFIEGKDGNTQRVETKLLNGRATLTELNLTKDNAPYQLKAYSVCERKLTGKTTVWPGLLDDFGKSVYFGETHLHCKGSDDGITSPKDTYKYSKDIAGLHFCGITNHAYHLINNGLWDENRVAAKEAYKPGEFVPFLGYEWDGFPWKGHLGVHFKDDVPEVIVSDSVENLWKELDASGLKYITKPHHPNAQSEYLPGEPCPNWREYDWDAWDDERQPLIEIFQMRGSFEKEELGDGVYQGGFGASAQSALARGYHIGFAGGGDRHDGRAGVAPGKAWRVPPEEVKIGLTALIADRLDRDSLWNAMASRNSYVATDRHTLIDFRVNNAIPGTRLDTCDGSVNIKIKIACPSEITSIILIRDGEEIKEINPKSELVDMEFDLENTKSEIPCGDSGLKHSYYYIRILRSDGHRAWTSPIFICGQ